MFGIEQCVCRGCATRPWLGVAAGLGVGLTVLVGRTPPVSRILAEKDAPGRLVLPHASRVVGVAFLLALAAGRLPAVFAVPAGLGDLAVALAALAVARRWWRGGGRRAVVWFNVLGLLDLVTAVTVGFLAGLGPGLLLAVTPSTEALGVLPLALIPVAVVPLAAGLHILSLWRLRTTPPRHATPPQRP